MLPGDIARCFDTTVPPPVGGPMSNEAVLKLIVKLKLSETAKTQCGKRLIAYYEAVASRGT